jgi:hypothetical protein
MSKSSPTCSRIASAPNWNERTPASRLIAEELSAAGRTRRPN